MNTPTFSADKSLYKSGRHYTTHGYTTSLAGEISLALKTGLSVGDIGDIGISGSRRLNAWGCWTGSCCVAGHYEAGPIGWQWVCDAWEPCERCLWPW